MGGWGIGICLIPNLLPDALTAGAAFSPYWWGGSANGALLMADGDPDERGSQSRFHSAPNIR